MSDDHVSTVMAIYEAFGRGDVPAVLGHLADDVRWDHGMRRTNVPYLKAVTGHAAVAEFFRVLDEQLEFLKFEISTAVASESRRVHAHRRLGRARGCDAGRSPARDRTRHGLSGTSEP